MSSERTGVYAEVELGLVGPEQMIVPLTATLSYPCSDPYAIRMAFYVGTDHGVLRTRPWRAGRSPGTRS